MENQQNEFLERLIDRHGNDRTALMDILRDVQAEHGWVSSAFTGAIAARLGIPRVEVAGFLSFYSFLSEEPQGKIVIRLCDDTVDRMKGYHRVLAAFEQALGISLGETTPDGKITLTKTACIGLSDQAPAALVNEVPVTYLDSDKVWEIVRQLQAHGDPSRLVQTFGDGNNAHELVGSMVRNNILEPGPLIFSPVNRSEAIRKAVAVSPKEVIRGVKAARLRGRGGAGFPTGMKWEFTRAAAGNRKFVICNADEGEPGTFKDRVILTERPDRVFAGMTIGAYAIGAAEGILYLRGEYAYLKDFLEDVLAGRRADGLLGANIMGKAGFDFDIRIQMGAGAYVCGEETALISSCEGRRGDPRNRPPFPAQRGFLGCPTVVNNVETLCCVTKILEVGPASFAEFGTPESSGTKLLSVSGDCRRPGVYELPFGITLAELLQQVGAGEAQAVQVGGPSGRLVGPAEFERKIDYDDLATGGAVMVFGPERDLFEIVHSFMDFFAEESCGYCTPCRVGNELLKVYLERIMRGQGEPSDLTDMQRVATTMKATSRCGLGQTSCNPVLTSLEGFRGLYDGAVKHGVDGDRRSFDLAHSVAEAAAIAGRGSVHLDDADGWTGVTQ